MNNQLIIIPICKAQFSPFGDWIDNGTCNPKSQGEDGTPCGSGEIKQRRTCQPGTKLKCDQFERERNYSCPLPEPITPCPGKCCLVWKKAIFRFYKIFIH